MIVTGGLVVSEGVFPFCCYWVVAGENAMFPCSGWKDGWLENSFPGSWQIVMALEQRNSFPIVTEECMNITPAQQHKILTRPLIISFPDSRKERRLIDKPLLLILFIGSYRRRSPFGEYKTFYFYCPNCHIHWKVYQEMNKKIQHIFKPLTVLFLTRKLRKVCSKLSLWFEAYHFHLSFQISCFTLVVEGITH